MENPFVYGEVVPAGAFVDRHDELKRLAADLVAGQKVFLISPRRYGKSSLISRALASAARARAAHGRGHRQQLQLVPLVPRRLRPGRARRRDALVEGRGLAARRHRRHATRDSSRDRSARIGRRRRLLPRRPFRARRRAPRARGLRAPRPARRRAAPARRRGPRRVPGDRQLQRRQRRGSACARRCSTSARSATSSPDRNRR